MKTRFLLFYSHTAIEKYTEQRVKKKHRNFIRLKRRERKKKYCRTHSQLKRHSKYILDEKNKKKTIFFYCEAHTVREHAVEIVQREQS